MFYDKMISDLYIRLYDVEPLKSSGCLTAEPHQLNQWPVRLHGGLGVSEHAQSIPYALTPFKVDEWLNQTPRRWFQRHQKDILTHSLYPRKGSIAILRDNHDPRPGNIEIISAFLLSLKGTIKGFHLVCWCERCAFYYYSSYFQPSCESEHISQNSNRADSSFAT